MANGSISLYSILYSCLFDCILEKKNRESRSYRVPHSNFRSRSNENGSGHGVERKDCNKVVSILLVHLEVFHKTARRIQDRYSLFPPYSIFNFLVWDMVWTSSAFNIRNTDSALSLQVEKKKNKKKVRNVSAADKFYI